MFNKLRVFLGIEHAENALWLAQHSIDEAKAILTRPYIPTSNPQSPKQGDQRVVKRFAWLPIRTMDGQRRWLQQVQIRQVYLCKMRKFGFGSVWTMIWANGEFVSD